MKRAVSVLFSVWFSLCCCVPAANAVSTSAVSAVLVDGDSGRILYSQNSDEKRLIASITKLMTALLAVEKIPDLQQAVTVKVAYTLTEGSSMYLQEGEIVTVETLLYGLLLSSGNDAALALADSCSGSMDAFVALMNHRAQQLGMKNTHFANPSGLNDEENYSTAADMALLAAECAKNETLMNFVSTKSITIGVRTFTNHNKLLWRYDGCIGMKTGYTERAGRTLISCARRDGQTLIAVTLDDADDWVDHTALLDYGFETYQSCVLATAGTCITSLGVTGSLVPRVELLAQETVSYAVKDGEEISSVLTLPASVAAPVAAGGNAGWLTFYLGDEKVAETALVYADSVRRDILSPGGLLPFLRSRLGLTKASNFLTVFQSDPLLSGIKV